MQLSRGSLKKIIKEEIQKMVEAEENTTGKVLASNLITEFKNLTDNDRQVFLNHFIGFLNEENT